jgi:hypothetical protein
VLDYLVYPGVDVTNQFFSASMSLRRNKLGCLSAAIFPASLTAVSKFSNWALTLKLVGPALLVQLQ